MNIRKRMAALVCSALGMVFVSVLHAAEQDGIVTVEALASQPQAVLGSTVVPYREVTLSAQTPGVVKYLAGDVGAGFNQGSLLLQIDEAQLLAKRNAVLAQIQTAQTSVQTSQVQHTRELISPRSKDIGMMPGFGLPAMFDMNLVRPFADSMMNDYDSDIARYSDLVSSAAGVSQAKSALQQAYSQLQEIDAGLRDTRSIAPFEGIIMEKLVEVGDTVQPGQPLIRFGYVRYKRLQADVPSSLVGALTVGMEAPVKIDGSAMTQAKVSQIYPVADPQRHTVTVKLDLPIDVVAAPGMYAEIYFPDGSNNRKTIAIPESALLSGRSLSSVLLVQGDTSVLRMVRTGSPAGDGRIEVVSGLNIGDKIIDNPPANAKSGWMPGQNQGQE